LTKKEEAHVSVFVTTKSGTRAYDWDLKDGDKIQMKYETCPTYLHPVQPSRDHYSNWLTLISGPEAGTEFHRPVENTK
jgi:hypothetical protein